MTPRAYKSAFTRAWNRLPHPYLKDAIHVHQATYAWIGGDPPVRMETPMYTYAAKWLIDDAPRPKDLAAICEWFTMYFVRLGVPPLPTWYKQEGDEIADGTDQRLVVPDVPVTHRLVERIPWECLIYDEWVMDRTWVVVRARLGVVRCDLQERD